MKRQHYLMIVQKLVKDILNFLIKPLFRGVSKKDPQKVIVIHQAPESNIQKFEKQMVIRCHRIELFFQP